MTTAQICIIIAIAVYLIIMVCVGVAYSRTSKGGADSFYLGGRKLGPVVTAMSAEASDMSSWLHTSPASPTRHGRPSALHWVHT